MKTDANKTLVVKIKDFMKAGGCIILPLFFGCAVFQTRPTQEMADSLAAIKAAEEVQADTLAPQLFRQAKEKYFLARREYRAKAFSKALSYADDAREMAEKAEVKALLAGANRISTAEPEEPPAVIGDPNADAGYEEPKGTYFEEQREFERETESQDGSGG